jgi:iron complex outermembrane receptor protein
VKFHGKNLFFVIACILLSARCAAALGVDHFTDAGKADGHDSKTALHPRARHRNTDSSRNTLTPINVGKVGLRTTRKTGASAKARRRNMESAKNTFILGRRDLEEAIPPGGSVVTALRRAPGIQVKGYGSGNGASRYQIRINGIQVGFSLAPGNPEKNGISVLFDGVPMNNPLAQYDGWESSETPIASIFSQIQATQGPGNPAHRWYDSMGGTIDLIPVSPSARSGAILSLGGGSFASYSASTMLQTGDLSGWRTELGGGYTHSDGFRTGEYHAPNQASAVFASTLKTFRDGDFSAGFFFSHTQEFRPLYIPTTTVPGVTTGGYGKPGTLLGQNSTGFYNTVPTSQYFKNDVAHMYLAYARLHVHLDRRVSLSNTLWYRSGYRHHYRVNNYYPHTINTEDFTGTTNTIGYRLALDVRLPENTVSLGGYYQHTRYQSKYYGYNPAVLHSSASFPLFVADYYDYWDGSSFFAQDVWRPISSLRITPGLQLLNYRVQFVNGSDAAIPPGSSPVTFAAANNESNYTELVPSVGLNDRLREGLHGYFLWAENYQTAPAAAYGNYQRATVETPSSPTKIESFIGGLKWQDRAWAAQLSAFHQDLTNAVIATFLPSDLISKLDRVEAVFNGVNLYLHYGRLLGWFAATRDTVQHAYYPSYLPAGAPALYGARIPGVPSYTLGFDLGYRWYRNETFFAARISDDYSSRTSVFNNNNNLPSTRYLPASAYNLVNVSLSATTVGLDSVFPGLRKLRVALQIENLLNRKYNSQGYITSGGEFGPASAGTILAVPGAPRAVYASLTAGF